MDKIVCANCDAPVTQAFLDTVTYFVHEPETGKVGSDKGCPHCGSMNFLLRKDEPEQGEESLFNA